MKTAIVIGGCGHIGSYLVPKLVENEYDVTVVSRGQKKPYNPEHPAWEKVRFIQCDRRQLAAERKFGPMIAAKKPDLIFDAVCYNRDMMAELCEAILADPAYAQRAKLIAIGSIWIYGYKLFVPVTEDHPHNDEGGYGRGKTEIENYLRSLSEQGLLNTTVLHPGHISGDGWYPINPQGNLNIDIYRDIIAGREILLPDDGSATLHHVHADDIAGLTMACLAHPEASCGQAFHAVSKHALSLRGFSELLYAHYGHTPHLRYLPFEEFKKVVSAEDANCTWDHIHRSPACSMEKAEKLLGFVPSHSSIDTVISALDWQMKKGNL